ncbi:hypothetical protein YC2023_076747 [Brassica napus]
MNIAGNRKHSDWQKTYDLFILKSPGSGIYTHNGTEVEAGIKNMEDGIEQEN